MILRAGEEYLAGLFVALPYWHGDANGREVRGLGYARQPVAFDRREVGYSLFLSRSEIVFGPAHDTWGWIAGVGIFDRDGRLLFAGPFSPSPYRMVDIGSRLVIATGGITVETGIWPIG